MVGAGGDVEDYIVAAKGWGDDGDIGEVGTAEFGVVGDDHVAAFQFSSPNLLLGADTGGHAAEVDGEMGCYVVSD